ncbi:MAG: class I SAM-dependent DNA methyltransferase [Pararhizobium sp.]
MAASSPIDEDALAEAYNRALSLEKAGDLDAAAAAYAEVLALDPEDHGGAAVRLASMGRGDTPPRAPQAYVTTLFDQHAEVFDTVLVEDLGYCVPLLLRQRLQALGLGPFHRLLDLGCGTGLTGGALRDMAGHITGVDLSEEMVAMADDREVYDDLYVGDIVDFVAEDDETPWDLVTATDVLPYLGELEPLLAGVARCTGAGSLFAFSSETLPEAALAGRPYMVGPHQRFAHAEGYLRSTLDAAGLEWVESTLITVRYENGEPIAGHLVIARRR